VYSLVVQIIVAASVGCVSIVALVVYTSDGHPSVRDTA